MKRKRAPRRGRPARIAISTEVCEEVLPWRWVQYPNHYGTFFAFADQPEGPFALCSCAIAAVENAIRFAKEPQLANANPRRLAPLSSRYFPDSLSERSLEKRGDPMTWGRFEPRLCHRCNLATPTLRYCHQMYGGQFMQMFGWYVNQTFFRMGIQPLSLGFLEGVCPDEIVQKIAGWRQVESEHQTELSRLMDLVHGEPRDDIASDEPTYWSNVKLGEEKRYVTLRRRAGRLRQAVFNELESITRKDFGFRAVGDGWISESILFNIVKGLFPDDEIWRHHRPDWLGGLELDIFVPRCRLAIEYQGQQHFRAVTAWGGEGALRELQQRDADKARTCSRKRVRLVTIDYTEPLSRDHIAARLQLSVDDPTPTIQSRDVG
jgi:hypothetical protein